VIFDNEGLSDVVGDGDFHGPQASPTRTGFHRERPRRDLIKRISGRNTGGMITMASVIVDHLDLSAQEFALATGWEIKPEGACKAEVCVPLGRSGGFDAEAAAARLGMEVVEDRDAGLWAFGPETLGNRSLVSAEAPELVLPDLNGNEFRLSTLRGQKVLLVAWAPY
jgi:hypothetical protein